MISKNEKALRQESILMQFYAVRETTKGLSNIHIDLVFIEYLCIVMHLYS